MPQRVDNTERGILSRFDPAQYDYGEVLLAHSKVYQLAHYKAIHLLQALALQRLQNTLVCLHPVSTVTGLHNIVGIIELTRDVYASTDHLEYDEEPLRGFVSTFVAHNFSALQTHPTMVQLLSEGGDLVIEVLRKLSNRPVTISPGLSISPRSVSRHYVARLNVSGLYPAYPGP